MEARRCSAKADRVSGISQSVNGKQVPAVQVIELLLQRLQSEIEILKVNTKDLPQEINDLRNKVLDIEAQLAPAAFSKVFSSTVHDLTTKSKAAIHTKVGKVLESQELRDRVSSQVVKQMGTEKTQRVLQDYAKKVVSSQSPEEIFERLHYMVDEVFVGVKERINKIEKELTAKMEVLSKETASRQL
ncbi:hypothetical protein AG0111_0g10812 [Alternaria gaisen]|uniref:Uncharacterized protein n=1 Tax=Alternaria gaisen TaxID=167740 RepID=A0ACB6F8S4_9PLEO|nr:hypothetical protein AG0111_0g10812 [Alternaria gaisen]